MPSEWNATLEKALLISLLEERKVIPIQHFARAAEALGSKFTAEACRQKFRKLKLEAAQLQGISPKTSQNSGPTNDKQTPSSSTNPAASRKRKNPGNEPGSQTQHVKSVRTMKAEQEEEPVEIPEELRDNWEGDAFSSSGEGSDKDDDDDDDDPVRTSGGGTETRS